MHVHFLGGAHYFGGRYCQGMSVVQVDLRPTGNWPVAHPHQDLPIGKPILWGGGGG